MGLPKEELDGPPARADQKQHITQLVKELEGQQKTNGTKKNCQSQRGNNTRKKAKEERGTNGIGLFVFLGFFLFSAGYTRREGEPTVSTLLLFLGFLLFLRFPQEEFGRPRARRGNARLQGTHLD